MRRNARLTVSAMTWRPSPQPTPHPLAPPVQLRVGVHDRSRAEWVCTVPMAPAGVTHNYMVVFELEVPDQIWVPHDPWLRYQARSRLTSPPLTISPDVRQHPRDRLRMRALSVAHALRISTREPQQILREAHRRDGQLAEAEADAVILALEGAVRTGLHGRAELQTTSTPDDPSVDRERELADEYISGHILMIVTRLRQALTRTVRRQGHPPRQESLQGASPRVLAALTAVLERELAYREQAHFRHAAPREAKEVEGFINRAADLKKHFQQALFLDARAYMLDDRLRNWIAGAMAMVAATFYFVWQVLVLNAATAGATTVSLVLAALVGALVYAAKDRIKEVGRVWLSEKLKHTYADRVVHLTVQERLDPRRSQLVLARETIGFHRHLEPDRFNPDLGRTQMVHHLRIRERLRHTGLATLEQNGLLGLKHVFRYDLSTLFAKLDDNPKYAPVRGPGGLAVRPGWRSYPLSVVVRLVRAVGETEEQLICHKGHFIVRGRRLIRFVPHPAHLQHPAHSADPAMGAGARTRVSSGAD